MDELSIEGKKDRLKECEGKLVHLYLDKDFSFKGKIIRVDTSSGEVILEDRNLITVERIFLYASDIKAIMLVKKTLSEVLTR